MGKVVPFDGKSRTERMAEAIRILAGAILENDAAIDKAAIEKAVEMAKEQVNTPEEGMVIEALGDFAEAILQAVEARYMRKLHDAIDALTADVFHVTDDVRHLQMDVMRLQDNGWGNRW